MHELPVELLKIEHEAEFASCQVCQTCFASNVQTFWFDIIIMLKRSLSSLSILPLLHGCMLIHMMSRA